MTKEATYPAEIIVCMWGECCQGGNTAAVDSAELHAEHRLPAPTISQSKALDLSVHSVVPLFNLRSVLFMVKPGFARGESLRDDITHAEIGISPYTHLVFPQIAAAWQESIRRGVGKEWTRALSPIRSALNARPTRAVLYRASHKAEPFVPFRLFTPRPDTSYSRRRPLPFLSDIEHGVDKPTPLDFKRGLG